MMTTQIYTIGYTGRNHAEIAAILDARGATLMDIRYSARSRNPIWTSLRLRQAFGSRYLHVPALGNVNYRGGDIEIADYASGRDLIAAWPTPVVLMCVCRDHHTCHRTTVAESLAAEGFTVTEIGAEAPAPKQGVLL